LVTTAQLHHLASDTATETCVTAFTSQQCAFHLISSLNGNINNLGFAVLIKSALYKASAGGLIFLVYIVKKLTALSRLFVYILIDLNIN
jgi:hypothetical protein